MIMKNVKVRLLLLLFAFVLILMPLTVYAEEDIDSEQNGYTEYSSIDEEDTEQPVLLRTPVITAEPQGATVKKGDAVTLSVIAAAPDDDDLLVCQWYANETEANVGGTAIDEATGSVYNPPTEKAGKVFYYCVITNMEDGSITRSQTAAVKVQGLFSGGGAVAIVIGGIEIIGFGGFAVYWLAVRKKRRTPGYSLL